MMGLVPQDSLVFASRSLVTLSDIFSALAAVVGMFVLRAVMETRDKTRDLWTTVFGVQGNNGLNGASRDHEQRLRRLEGREDESEDDTAEHPRPHHGTRGSWWR